MEKRVNRTRSSSSIGSTGSKKPDQKWIPKRTSSHQDLKSLEKQEEIPNSKIEETKSVNNATEASSLKSEEDRPVVSSVENSVVDSLSEIQESITPPKRMSRSSSLDGKAFPRIVHRARRTTSNPNIRRALGIGTNYSEFDNANSMERFSAPQPRNKNQQDMTDDENLEDCDCVDCDKRRIQIEIKQGVKETRGLLAERETETFTFVDHDHATDLSMFASLHLGPFAAHIFEFTLLSLLVTMKFR